MPKKKIHILGIAPFQSLKTSMETIAASYESLELTTYVGDLEAGAQLARQYMNDGYDIIISRGGTASMIREFSTIPVIEIPLTVYDILRTLRLCGPSAPVSILVGFPNITTPAARLCELLDYKIEIKTVHNKQEAFDALAACKNRDIQFVLCDALSQTLARQHGLHPILITSGSESIKDALEQALQICTYSASLRQRHSILIEALKNQPSYTIILQPDGCVFFSNYDAENIDAVLEYLQKLLLHPHKAKQSKAFHLIEQTLYAISIRQNIYEDTILSFFYIEPNPVPSQSSKYGLRYTSYSQIADRYTNSFYALTSSSKTMEKQIAPLLQSNLPIMILGERGTGKNQIAARLYMDGPWNDHPYIIIDCLLVNDKNWKFITTHHNSPLFDQGNTIFISNIESLEDTRQQQLLSLILDTNTHRRNRLIFSCSDTGRDTNHSPAGNFINYLSCTTIFLPPLRELTSDIPSSASLYLNALNIELNRQVAGFEPEALQLLCSYNWPDNFEQLKRVLANLVLLSSSQTIDAASVAQVLKKEQRQYVPATQDNFNYNRSLQEMIHDIAKVVLSNCDNNQTRAAKQLGIGRTTLWRYLNDEE